MGAMRRVCRNVKWWRNAAMALRWTAAGMMEAAKGFRRLKAYKHLPVLRAALAAHQSKYVASVGFFLPALSILKSTFLRRAQPARETPAPDPVKGEHMGLVEFTWPGYNEGDKIGAI